MADLNYPYSGPFLPQSGYQWPLPAHQGAVFDQKPLIFDEIHIQKNVQEIRKPDGLSREEREWKSKQKVLKHNIDRLQLSDVPGQEYALNYLQLQYRKFIKSNTLRSIGASIYSFLSFLSSAGKRNLAEITRIDIELYVEQEQNRGLKAVSVHGRIRSIYPFLHYLVKQNLIDPSVIEHRIKLQLPVPLPRAIDSEDVNAILVTIDVIRDKALILLLLRTGMRIGEALELRVDDINFEKQAVMIYVGEKNGQGRQVYFADDAKEALLAWLEVRKGNKRYLFYGYRDNPLTYVAAWSCFHKYLKKAGLENKGYSPHCLRHTFATDILNAGMPIEVLQELLGHSNLEMTKRYARLTNKTREEEYFKAMRKLETKGEDDHGHQRISSKLQAVFEKKKLFTPHN